MLSDLIIQYVCACVFLRKDRDRTDRDVPAGYTLVRDPLLHLLWGLERHKQ